MATQISITLLPEYCPWLHLAIKMDNWFANWSSFDGILPHALGYWTSQSNEKWISYRNLDRPTNQQTNQQTNNHHSIHPSTRPSIADPDLLLFRRRCNNCICTATEKTMKSLKVDGGSCASGSGCIQSVRGSSLQYGASSLLRSYSRIDDYWIQKLG